MPRTAIPVTSITRAGVVAPTEANGDPGNGNSVPNNGSIWIEVRNSGSVTRTLSINFPNAVDGQAVTPKAYPITAGTTRRIGPFPTKDYGTTLLLNPDNAELKILAWRL